MSSENPVWQPATQSDIDIEADILLELCCGCVDSVPRCVYCSLRKKGELAVTKFRQVPGKVYGCHVNEEGSSNMVCESNFATFRIHGDSGSFPLVSLLDPDVEVSYPPIGVKNDCMFSISRRGPSNVSELWHMLASSEQDARDWFEVLKAPRPKRATASCAQHIRIQRFLMRAEGVCLPDPSSDVFVKQSRNYWAAADRVAGSFYTFVRSRSFRLSDTRF
jgi:hypothetical protein